ncbi:MAG: hypothetical protein AAF471_05440 [Myxococcota bacterium]
MFRDTLPPGQTFHANRTDSFFGGLPDRRAWNSPPRPKVITGLLVESAAVV